MLLVQGLSRVGQFPNEAGCGGGDGAIQHLVQEGASSGTSGVGTVSELATHSFFPSVKSLSTRGVVEMSASEFRWGSRRAASPSVFKSVTTAHRFSSCQVGGSSPYT